MECPVKTARQILLVDFWFLMNPPSMMVSPFLTAISEESVRLSVLGTLPTPSMGVLASHIINFLIDVHDHQAVGIDERRDIQLDTDRQLRVRRAIANSSATVITTGDIRKRLADKKLSRFGLRSLDARALDDARVTVSLRRL